MKPLAFILVLYVLLASSSSALSLTFDLDSGKSQIKIKDKILIIELADSELEWVHGLQGRMVLPEDEGMLFDYGTELGQLSFWMKDTLIPLSIAFIDKDGVIREIQDMQPGSLESHRSRDRVRYALEVNQGWFKRNQIREGDRIEK